MLTKGLTALDLHRDRGRWIERKGFNMIATFHLAALFRDESKKQLFWKDLKSVKRKYEELLNKWS